MTRMPGLSMTEDPEDDLSGLVGRFRGQRPPRPPAPDPEQVRELLRIAQEQGLIDTRSAATGLRLTKISCKLTPANLHQLDEMVARRQRLLGGKPVSHSAILRAAIEFLSDQTDEVFATAVRRAQDFKPGPSR